MFDLGPYFFEGNLAADICLPVIFPNYSDNYVSAENIWFQQDDSPHFRLDLKNI